MYVDFNVNIGFTVFSVGQKEAAEFHNYSSVAV